MRFMVIVKADESDPDAFQPSEEVLEAMGRYNEELVKAGVMLAGEGLHPTSKGALVQFRNGRPTVVDGPFSEAKEVVGGFWVLEVTSREEALEWVKRIPADPNATSRVEVRQLLTDDDFGAAMTDELRGRHERMREHIADQQS
ncbi:YciI family protein [Actinophytocola xanthii]|uniref:Dehydrogenase n=1 Tax=Actinophytocola xanthii TaxID=1912961 RepID=A0A1Q8CYH7_9PSEU|nr:YciI family protein [Actinophytocola xanthii]OLF19412.1 dehydrogenase [Actinophytocola xanthii]